MSELSDAFVMLPGGFGTYEEFMESVTWAQLGIHDKRCAVLNVDGFFDQLLAFLAHAVDSGFIKPRQLEPGAGLQRGRRAARRRGSCLIRPTTRSGAVAPRHSGMAGLVGEAKAGDQDSSRHRPVHHVRWSTIGARVWPVGTW